MIASAYSEDTREKMETNSKQYKGLEGKSSVVEKKIENMGNNAKAGMNMSTISDAQNLRAR